MNIKAIRMLSNTCPNCGKGKVFNARNILFSLGFSTMKHKCDHCHYKFEREPGFFIGAMYASYGLAVIELFLGYFLVRPFFEDAFDLRILAIISITLLLLSFFNYRLSRILWIYTFKK